MKPNIFYLVAFLFVFSLSAQNKIVQLYYDTDVYTLTTNQKNLLSAALDSLNNGSNYYFNITGYTDDIASKEYNMKLSQKRANNIKDFIEKKYPQLIKSIDTSAHGELISKDNPDTSSKKGVFENRRVDVIIMFAGKTDYIPLDETKFMGLEYANLKTGDSVELRNLHFVLNTTNLEEKSQKMLDTLVQELRNHKTVKITIEGHVCCGDVYTYYAQSFKQKQKQLSEDRAKAIYDYLIKRGISQARLSYFGYGFKRPKVYPEKTEADKAANRRVIIKITYL